MNNRKRGFLLLTLSAAGIVVVSLLSSKVAPLYDGVGFPDEAYRYVSAPKSDGSNGLPPSPARTIAVISNNSNSDDISLASLEQGPQINITIFKHSLKDSISNDKVGVKASPEAPDGNAPKAGRIAGNVYSLKGSSGGGGKVTFNSSVNPSGYIDLRFPQGFQPGALIVYRSSPAARWESLTTNRVGNDIYESYLKGFGDYATVPSKNANPAHHVVNPILIALAVIFAILAAALVAVRLIVAGGKKHK